MEGSMHYLALRLGSLFHRQRSAGAGRRPASQLGLVFRAYLQLLRFESPLKRGNLAVLYEKVRTCKQKEASVLPGDVERVCAAVTLACVFYWKQVLCLQRSATIACLLKRIGVPAHLVIGVQPLPFKAHAWVEVHDRVLSDEPEVCSAFEVLDRC
jgi:hypothetical protein